MKKAIFFLKTKQGLLLLAILILAITLRLLDFPHNVYFASDQARDAFYSFEVINGNFKVSGPGSSFSSILHHGVLYYYVMGPVYFLSQGNPYIPALVINILNSFGVVIVFFIGKNLFKTRIGLIAAFLYAVSFEQTQYALFFSHPGLALTIVLMYYLGLTLLFFKGNSKGLVLAAISAGLATQLHLSLAILIILLPIYLLLFKSRLSIIKSRDILLAVLGFFLSISTFVIAEIKFKQFMLYISDLGSGTSSGFTLNINNFIFAVNRYVHDNLIVVSENGTIGVLIVVIIFYFLVKQKLENGKILFLFLWFLTGCFAYIIGSSTTYYYGIGGSVSLLIAAAVLIYYLFSKNLIFGIFILFIIAGSNLYQIVNINPKGPIGSVMAPPGMLLTDEQQAIDYIYSESQGEPFSIHALTIPYNVKTTWDYLFNWYGKQKYGFVPVWGGEDALGSEGSLQVVRARSTLPTKQFLIIEPLAGLANKIVEDFLREESYFTHLKAEKKFGVITVQTREKY